MDEEHIALAVMFILYAIVFCAAAVVGGYLFHIGWNFYHP
jgi:hypothetical protein